jgi:hypothetical protein
LNVLNFDIYDDEYDGDDEYDEYDDDDDDNDADGDEMRLLRRR